MKKVFIVLLVLIVQSCGYFEKDNNEIKEKITENFNITKRENNNFYELVYINGNGEVSSIVNENCIHVVFDSINNVIFTERYLNPYNSSYYKIKNIYNKEYKKIDLTKEQYLNQVKKCDNCIEKFNVRPPSSAKSSIVP